MKKEQLHPPIVAAGHQLSSFIGGNLKVTFLFLFLLVLFVLLMRMEGLLQVDSIVGNLTACFGSLCAPTNFICVYFFILASDDKLSGYRYLPDRAPPARGECASRPILLFTGEQASSIPFSKSLRQSRL